MPESGDTDTLTEHKLQMIKTHPYTGRLFMTTPANYWRHMANMAGQSAHFLVWSVTA